MDPRRESLDDQRSRVGPNARAPQLECGGLQHFCVGIGELRVGKRADAADGDEAHNHDHDEHHRVLNRRGTVLGN